ncbi:hypothetical protein ACKF11_13355 [Methylobacillus sp. Pita2]|uniref:hypothetical protein n=1 Tax=Methylobacillus sp. Pita2 TaxID=3383245 RepID=UPI0038B50AA7
MKIAVIQRELPKQPAIGDVCVTKKHGTQYRIPVMSNGHHVFSNGRRKLQWVAAADLPERWKHLAQQAA